MYKLPTLQQLNLEKIMPVHGYYTLGIIKKYCPDVAMIFMRLARNDFWTGSDLDPELLTEKIQKQLQQNKKVLVVPSDEYVMDHNYNFSEVLNQFENDHVYFVTEMDAEKSLFWTFQKKLRCKILELPFVLTNDAVCYNKLYKLKQKISAPKSHYNFLCMVNRSESSKYDVCKMLLDLDLAKHGLITYRDPNAPQFIKDNCFFNQNEMLCDSREPSNLPTKNRQEAGQVYDNNILASGCVLNWFQIDQQYGIPLIINPETTLGIFPNTDKSIWPALLGKMYLIYGHQGVIKWIQRFCDYGPENFSDLAYDNVQGYEIEDHMARLETMLVRNTDLIRNAHVVYMDHKTALEQNRQTFVENLYNFFASQIYKVGSQ